MRSEQEMMDLIINTAKQDDRIRSVLLSGSRADENAPRDIYQDYDIVYFVEDRKLFYNNIDWIEEKFGKPAIMQLPELMEPTLLPPKNDGHFTYLMIFEDGNRIDLTVDKGPYIHNGEPAIVLLDKDGMLEMVKTRSGFWNIQPPTAEAYRDACNEFWWCLNNVAKGIAREELAYSMVMLQSYVRDMLNQMTDWYIGIQNDFGVSVGKMGKYYRRYLTGDLYARYTSTYCAGDYPDMWRAVWAMCDLFHDLAESVSIHFGYGYNTQEEKGMREYLQKVRDHKLI